MAVSARHYARLGAVQFLYAWNFQKQSLSGTEDQVLIDTDVLLHGDMRYLQKLLKSIPPRIAEIDAAVSEVIDRKIETIDPVELSILRLGVYELLAEPDIPSKVTANECIELSKEFGNPGSYKFINGTLDRLAFGKPSPLHTIQDNSQQSAGREFELINKYFARSNDRFDNVVQGVGDDSAVVEFPADRQLVISTDTLLENVHFSNDTAPEDVGYKSLAVALSDLAAMGAHPEFATLNLSVPFADESWLNQFSNGFYEIAERFNVALIGGDTAKGPLAVSVTVFGSVDARSCVLRSGAQPGDGIYVTGPLGDAALGLLHASGSLDVPDEFSEYLLQRLNRPFPRIDVGLSMHGHVTSAIDISDGLAADLTHIIEQSGAGAQVDLERVPISAAYRQVLGDVGWSPALSGGDDYELCVTVPDSSATRKANLKWAEAAGLIRIGTVTEGSGLVIAESGEETFHLEHCGYSHF
ncbi:MAG: thiamine-phosphate kinase [Acidiferrobacterales bacterium]|nr:thiamine-phosphate kinase [Acidiferrobacterales bacterium]